MSAMITEPFWMIVGIGQGAPTVRHQTFLSAETEAKRLARQHPGIDFVVLRSVAVARKVDVEFSLMAGADHDEEVPF